MTQASSVNSTRSMRLILLIVPSVRERNKTLVPPPPRAQEPFPEDRDPWGCRDALQELQPGPHTLQCPALNVPSAAGATQQM